MFIEKDNVIELKRVRWVRNKKAFAHWMEAECHYTAVDKRLRFKRLMKEAWPDPRNKPPKGPRRMGDPDIFFTPAERLDARAEDALGVPVERKQQLKIDTANGTWEIIGRKETFRPGKYYRLETETVEKGTLKKAVPVSSGGKKVQKGVNKEQP